jgi:negative modulator of initiation of replication
VEIEVSIRFNETESKDVASLLKLFQGSAPVVTPEVRSSLERPSEEPSPFAQFLQSPTFRAERDVLGRFKKILSWLYADNPDFFDTMVEEYVETARGRVCLGRSESEVNESGTNVKAQQIQSTPYWVETNSDTAKKKRHLNEWMIGLAREDAEIDLALAALGESQPRG